MDLAIVIPTKDRSELLLGQLFFYESYGLPVHVYIGDSSSEKEKEKIKKGIASLKNIRVTLLDYDSTVMQADVIFRLLSSVIEPFTTISGDDDYHVLSASNSFIDFLKKNEDFSCCTGHVAMINTSMDQFRRIDYVSDYSPKKSILGNSAMERIEDLSKNYYLPLFCICRTKDLVDSFTIQQEIKSNIIWAETLPAFKMIAKGKQKVFPVLSFIRGTHTQRLVYHNGLKDTFMSQVWSKSLQACLDELELELTKKDKIPREKAKEGLYSIFSDYYLEDILKRQGIRKKSFIEFIPSRIRKGLKPLYFFLKPHGLNSAVLKSRSIHFKTFKTLQDSFKRASEI